MMYTGTDVRRGHGGGGGRPKDLEEPPPEGFEGKHPEDFEGQRPADFDPKDTDRGNRFDEHPAEGGRAFFMQEKN